MTKKDLNEGWRLCHAPLFWDETRLEEIRRKKEGWMTCSLPADIHMPLIESGRIKDPVVADNCFDAEWTEKYSWWFLKEFSVQDADMDAECMELVLERLDANASVFLNGHLLGVHKSVHYPFIKDVKEYIVPGNNEIAVRVTTGLEEISDRDLSELNWAVCREQDNGGKDRSDYRRAFVRRPQYTVGWDWCPRIVTCGITGKAYLRCLKGISIRQAEVHTAELRENSAVLSAMVCVENLDMLSTRACDITFTVYDGEKKAAEKQYKDMLLMSGDNYVRAALEIAEPKLWWPNGYGEQPLYRIECTASWEGGQEQYTIPCFGIRTIELDTSSLGGNNRKFQFAVNGVPIFCKGGDWIPNDSIYARVTDEKVEKLLEEAVEANFNMLRIWGGGLYESDFFYETCTRKGILIWHDFMFACAVCPDHREEFKNLVREELDYQTKRLRNYSCIALFCGSNENHWLFNHYDNPKWGISYKHDKPLGLYIANQMARDIIYSNCTHILYWNSSPYGGTLPNDETAGDVHQWRDPGYMSDDMALRTDMFLYDQVAPKFVSEYGCVGPCCMESIKEYMGTESVQRTGKVWEMHCNVFEKETVQAGIEAHYRDDAKSLSMEDYVLYGGMVQGQVLGYSLEAFRFRRDCFGALVWMYNDAWGENGWTIIDYYLRRKISFYAVKRALSHIKLIIRARDGKVMLMGCNDTPKPVQVSGEWGYVSFDGRLRETEKVSFTLQPGTRECVCQDELPEKDYAVGAWMFIPDSSAIDGAYLRTGNIRDMQYQPGTVETVSVVQEGEDTLVTVRSESFAHGVYIPEHTECSDNYFDILPGEEKTIRIRGGKGKMFRICQIK